MRCSIYIPVCPLSSSHNVHVLSAYMQVVQQLIKQLDTKKKELADFQDKYKIRIRVSLLRLQCQLGTGACSNCTASLVTCGSSWG